MLFFFIYTLITVYLYIIFFKKKYNMLPFILFNRGMMVNLYKLYFKQNKKVFYSSTFLPSQLNTNERN